MLRIVLWLAAGAVVLLGVLAISRGVNFTAGEPKKVEAPSVEEKAEPAAAVAPEPSLPVAPPAPPTPEEMQVQEDAAATGMTTMEPEDEPAPAPSESAPPQPPQ